MKYIDTNTNYFMLLWCLEYWYFIWLSIFNDKTSGTNITNIEVLTLYKENEEVEIHSFTMAVIEIYLF